MPPIGRQRLARTLAGGIILRIGFHGRLVDEPEIRAGFIGCGSHSFRNIYPTFQFAPVRLVATCDLDKQRADAFAAKFGAEASYSDFHEMLERDDLDCVFIVTGYDERGRPLYPKLAIECLQSGRHVFIEKPPAASSTEVEAMISASEAAGKNVLVAMKKMFFPANVKARELAQQPEFGEVTLALLQYPQSIPEPGDFQRYADGECIAPVVGFLDHLCHPVSLMLYLLGMPRALYYERSASGSGCLLFTFASGAVCSIALTAGSSLNGGLERTTIISNRGRHIVVDNNIRVSYHRIGTVGYGDNANFYVGPPEEATAAWEPEFSLGQLYNKGLALQGYYDEVNEFARGILEGSPCIRGTLEQAWQATRIFEACAAGPGKTVALEQRV